MVFFSMISFAEFNKCVAPDEIEAINAHSLQYCKVSTRQKISDRTSDKRCNILNLLYFMFFLRVRLDVSLNQTICLENKHKIAQVIYLVRQINKLTSNIWFFTCMIFKQNVCLA